MQISTTTRTIELNVRNVGERPVQIGSSFHFYNASATLDFDRRRAFGRHLNLPAGSALCFNPGEEIIIELVEFAEWPNQMGFGELDSDYSGQEDMPTYYPKRLEAFRRVG